MLSQYQNQLNSYQNQNFNNLKNISHNASESSSVQENKVPPVQKIYRSQNQSKYNYNSFQYNPPRLIKIYPPNQEPICNCNMSHQNYPIINNNSIPLKYYFNEENNNYNYRCPCTPKQTIISLTPMRTINDPKSPYQDINEIQYNYDNNHNNQARYLRKQRNMGFRALTPDRINNFEKQQFEVENNNNEYYNDNYNNRRRNKNSYSLYHNRKVVEPILIVDDDEPINEDNLPEPSYERGQRIRRSDY